MHIPRGILSEIVTKTLQSSSCTEMSDGFTQLTQATENRTWQHLHKFSLSSQELLNIDLPYASVSLTLTRVTSKGYKF